MTWQWYKLFQLDQFLATGLASRTIIAVLEGRGRATITINRGCLVSITYLDTYLPVKLLGMNPYIDEGRASFIDSENNVWLGIES